MNVERCEDNGKTIYSFHDEFLVQCPGCNACAIVRRIEPNYANYLVFATIPTSFVC